MNQTLIGTLAVAALLALAALAVGVGNVLADPGPGGGGREKVTLTLEDGVTQIELELRTDTDNELQGKSRDLMGLVSSSSSPNDRVGLCLTDGTHFVHLDNDRIDDGEADLDGDREMVPFSTLDGLSVFIANFGPTVPSGDKAALDLLCKNTDPISLKQGTVVL